MSSKKKGKKKADARNERDDVNAAIAKLSESSPGIPLVKVARTKGEQGLRTALTYARGCPPALCGPMPCALTYLPMGRTGDVDHIDVFDAVMVEVRQVQRRGHNILACCWMTAPWCCVVYSTTLSRIKPSAWRRKRSG
jgi:hypothetical protein